LHLGTLLDRSRQLYAGQDITKPSNRGHLDHLGMSQAWAPMGIAHGFHHGSHFFCNQKYGIWGSPAEEKHHQTDLLRRDATNFSDAMRVALVCSSKACTSHQIQQRLDLTGS
jgi:hypothetical protein